MARQAMLRACRPAAVLVALLLNQARVEAQGLNELIAGAKKEPEMAFTAGPTTFGGRQSFSEIQAAFNKKFGLNARINLNRGTEHAGDGGADHHGSQSRQKIIHRRPLGSAGNPCGTP
jgi:hypothetical protein